MKLTDSELLAKRIAQAGTTSGLFAKIMGRSERQIRRWLNEGQPIPADSRSWLERLRSVRVLDGTIFVVLNPPKVS